MRNRIIAIRSLTQFCIATLSSACSNQSCNKFTEQHLAHAAERRMRDQVGHGRTDTQGRVAGLVVLGVVKKTNRPVRLPIGFVT